MNITWGLLSKYRNELYGISIIWIILFHGLELKQTALPNGLQLFEPILKHGNCGVEIFLFLSGICLYFSLKKNSSIICFFKKRVARILGSFLIIDATFWLYTCIYQKHSLLEFIQNITFYSFWAGKNKMVWFIALIVFLYAIYPVVFKFLERYDSIFSLVLLIVGICCMCYLLNLCYPKWFHNVEIALTRIPIFLLGCYCGKFVYNDIEIRKGVKIVTFLLLIYGIAYFFQHPYSLVKAYRIPYFFIGSSITIWLAICFETLNSQRLNRIMYLWGGLSLELYLSHVVLRKLFVNSILYSKNATYNYFFYIVVCCFGAFVISYFVNKINERYMKNILK